MRYGKQSTAFAALIYSTPRLCATLALCLAGCAGTVTRATPEEMRAAPGASSRLTSSTPYDRAYTLTLEQLKACFERGGTVHVSVFGDKSAKTASVSLSLSSMLGYKILTTLSLTPSATGTDVALYAANEVWHTKLQRGLTEWLIAGTRQCPDDTIPVNETASYAN